MIFDKKNLKKIINKIFFKKKLDNILNIVKIYFKKYFNIFKLKMNNKFLIFKCFNNKIIIII